MPRGRPKGVKGKCSNCDQEGHNKRTCEKPKRIRRYDRTSEYNCSFCCNVLGKPRNHEWTRHSIRTCPHQKKELRYPKKRYRRWLRVFDRTYEIQRIRKGGE